MLELNVSTILLQMANFLILVYILTRFLFKPLQRVLERRNQEATKRLDEAEAAKQEAEAARVSYEEKRKNIDAEIAARKNEARIVVEQTRQQMLQEVKAQVEALRVQAEETLKQQRTEALSQHRSEIGELVAKLVAQTTSDIMTPQLERVYQDKFLEQLRNIDLAGHINANGSETIVAEITSVTPLSESYKKHLEAILDTAASYTLDLAYQEDPGLIAGVIIRLEDVLIDGSVHGQIQQLQKRYQEETTA